LPEANVEVTESRGGFGGYGGYGASRFDEATHFGSSYGTPGWQRAQRRSGGFEEEAQPDFDDGMPSGGLRRSRGGLAGRARRASPLTIEGELVARSTGTASAFAVGDRVFHLKFGNGNVTAVDGNKLSVHFDQAGEKRVVDSFVERV
jgi:DNA helicase-2/ATP-dependent DNA helicase PcrA